MERSTGGETVRPKEIEDKLLEISRQAAEKYAPSNSEEFLGEAWLLACRYIDKGLEEEAIIRKTSRRLKPKYSKEKNISQINKEGWKGSNGWNQLEPTQKNQSDWCSRLPNLEILWYETRKYRHWYKLRNRIIFYLFLIERMNTRDIADLLGVTTSCVYSSILYLKEAIRVNIRKNITSRYKENPCQGKSYRTGAQGLPKGSRLEDKPSSSGQGNIQTVG